MNKILNNIIDWGSIVHDMIKMDLIQFFRQRMIVISSFLTSMSMILSFGIGMNEKNVQVFGFESYFAFIAPGIFAIAMMFSSVFTMGYGTIIDRQKRIIEDMVLSPVSYSSFIAARYIAMVLKAFMQLCLIVFISVIIFKMPLKYPWMLFLNFINITIFFSALGIILASFNNEMSFAGVANFILLPLFYFGGVFFPIENLGSISHIIKFLPLPIHVSLFKYATSGIATFNVSLYFMVTVIYSITAIIISGFIFKYIVKSHR